MCCAARFGSMSLVLPYLLQRACVSIIYTAVLSRRQKRLREDIDHVHVGRPSHGMQLVADGDLTCDTNARCGERSPNAYRMRSAYI